MSRKSAKGGNAGLRSSSAEGQITLVSADTTATLIVVVESIVVCCILRTKIPWRIAQSCMSLRDRKGGRAPEEIVSS
jgi:hypothetical protein